MTTTCRSFVRESAEGIQMDSSSQYKELYERAREATKEAQREGDARLKAAMAAATAARYNPIRLSMLSLKFNNSILETAYRRKSSTNSDIKDVVPFACHLVVSILFIFILFQAYQEGNAASMQWKEFPHLDVPTFSVYLVLHTCFAAVSAGVLVIQLGFAGWYRSNRGTILLYSVSLLWIEEAIKLFVSYLDSSYDLTFTSFQCVFTSVLHRIPFCLHLKTRALGFGLQTVAILARGRFDGAAPAFSFVCLGHCLGVALAYALDQQSRSKFLQSLPKWILDEMSGDGSRPQFLPYRASFSRQMLHIFYPELFEKPRAERDSLSASTQQNQQTPRRALGGFAGGFGGVSSLKGTYAPAFSSVSSSSNSFSREDEISECSDNFCLDDEKKAALRSSYQNSPDQALSRKEQGQPSNSCYSTAVPNFRMYRRFQASTGQDAKK